jgi:uncharacterized protein (TIGR00251 family)
MTRQSISQQSLFDAPPPSNPTLATCVAKLKKLSGEVFWSEDKTRLLLFVQIKAGAKQSAVTGAIGGRLKISLNAPAIEGRANAELIAFLSEQLGQPKSTLWIKSGEHARLKTIAWEPTH